MAPVIDLTGQTFSDLVVLGYDEAAKRWDCRCACGSKTKVATGNLNSGVSKSCGCRRSKTLRAKTDLTGKVFGRLTVLGRNPERGGEWRCRCQCGNECSVRTGHLKERRNKSCGCGFISHGDITGQVFGCLTAIRPVSSVFSNNSKCWLCQCSCGGQTIAGQYNLERGSHSRCSQCQPTGINSDGIEFFVEDEQHAKSRCEIYLVEVAGAVDKIGISKNLKARGKGAYSQIWWRKRLPRAVCWAVEQVALFLTRSYKPAEPVEVDCGGLSEQRTGWVLEETIELLEELCAECVSMGWRPFYAKYMP